MAWRGSCSEARHLFKPSDGELSELRTGLATLQDRSEDPAKEEVPGTPLVTKAKSQKVTEDREGAEMLSTLGKEMVARGTKTRWQTPGTAGPGAELSVLRDSGGLPVPKHHGRAHLPRAGERGGTKGQGVTEGRSPHISASLSSQQFTLNLNSKPGGCL